MKNLRKSIYLFLTLAFFISCEKETTIPNGVELNNSNNESTILQENTFTSEHNSENFVPTEINFNKSNKLNAGKEGVQKNIGILSNYQGSSWSNFLTTNGYNVVLVNQAYIDDVGLGDLDALLYFRGGESIADANKANILNFVNNGGIFITEFSTTTDVMQNFNISEPATLYNSFYYFGTSNINVNQSHPMSEGLPSTFYSGGQIQYFQLFNNLDSNFQIVATLNSDLTGDSINEPVVGTYCYGNGVWVAFFSDFGDLYDSSSSEELLLAINMIEFPLDSCSDDSDNDGILNTDDNCRNIPNANQADNDEDGIGDVCDDDDDNDGILDEFDNCPFTANANQADFDGDDIGDACDNDSDNDGVLNNKDAHIYSIIGGNININGCNPNVNNVLVRNGSTMMDQIGDLINEINSQYNGGNYDYLNRKFIMELERKVTDWRRNRLVNNMQRDAISRCARSARIPYLNQPF